jgi:hypothetical protein
MAFELSNKALALLLVVAVVVSLGGTMVSMSRLNKLESAESITGYSLYTTVGGVNVTITSTTAINFTTNYVNFGTGIVNGSCGFCNMYTISSGTGVLGPCCQDFTAPSSGLILENIGNVNVSLEMNSSMSALDFIGGSGTPGPQFRMNVSEKEAYSCANLTYAPGSGLNETWNNTFAEVPTSNSRVCQRFRPDIASDELRIDINITVPDNSYTGLRTAVLSATASTLAS